MLIGNQNFLIMKLVYQKFRFKKLNTSKKKLNIKF